MQILGNLFYALLYVSFIGGMFTVLSLFAGHVLGLAVPLWFSAGCMVFYAVPFLSADVVLLPPERQLWGEGFWIALGIWLCGCLVCLAGSAVRLWLAGRAVRACLPCRDKRLNDLADLCADMLGFQKRPPLLWGTLDDPVCVAGAVRPAILLRKPVAERLTDQELLAVFAHELTHIKRRHLLLTRVCFLVCAANWFNPLVWLAKKEVSLRCETDCDEQTLAALGGKISKKEYASAVLRLLELSAHLPGKSGAGMGAARFFLTKQRIRQMLAGTSKGKRAAIGALLAGLLLLTVWFSMWFGRQHFYPYPAYNSGAEYSGAVYPGLRVFV